MSNLITPEWLQIPVAILDKASRKSALHRQTELTKPPGSLGRLEEIVFVLASLQGSLRPDIQNVQITIFAADHGIALEGVSAFPQAVTAEMIKNFSRGGAAINVLARSLDAQLEIINLGTAHDIGSVDNVRHYPLGRGTKNFIYDPAMTGDQLVDALNIGRQTVKRAVSANMQLFIGGEMGIGNTTSASTLSCILLNAEPELIAGPGAGLDAHGVTHKIDVIQRAINFHGEQSTAPLETLRRVGGFEIAALVGAYIHCAQMGLPVLIDGFISSVAALTAERICPDIKSWLLFSHISAEPGHGLILDELQAKPLLNLSLRLGEGSGAAIALPLLRMACDLHNEMATFAEAQISQKS